MNSSLPGPIYLLPGMGADRRMYPAPWTALPDATFIEWPEYHGEKSVRDVAQRLMELHRFPAGCTLVGTSLGGIVAGEIAKLVRLRSLVLVGSATQREDVSRLLAVLHPLADLAPVEFIQRAAGKVPNELTQMLSAGDPRFIRAMSRAIFSWEGIGPQGPAPLRIHGMKDRVILPPPAPDLAIDGGHLISITHAGECVQFIRARVLGEGGRIGA